jgi:uncharacterized alkaline shock family protein YloU
MSGRTPQLATHKPAQGDAATQARHELKIATTAITRIAAATAREVKGLHLTEFRRTFLNRLGIGNQAESPETGIRATINTAREVSLTLSMSADYGVHIPTLAADLQQRLEEKIARMTDFHTRSVRMEIVDVLVPEEASVPVAPEA